MSSSNSTHGGIDRAALARVVEPVVAAHGAELVDLEFRPEHAGWVLRINVEKAGASEQRLSTRDAAVDLELCANVARDLSPALDVAELIAQAYRLEVGSPGIERSLRGERDMVRFTGQKAKLTLRAPLNLAEDAGQAGGAPGEGAPAGGAPAESASSAAPSTGSGRAEARFKARRGRPGGLRVVVGTLEGVTDGKVRVAQEQGGRRVLEVPLSSVESAHLVFEFGTQQQRKH